MVNPTWCPMMDRWCFKDSCRAGGSCDREKKPPRQREPEPETLQTEDDSGLGGIGGLLYCFAAFIL
jgi:hypothetical protein